MSSAGGARARSSVVAEASPRQTKHGRVFDGDGWFVLNARETRWRDDGRPFGVFCDFEGKRRFKQIGISLYVLAPGELMSMYAVSVLRRRSWFSRANAS